MTFDMIASRVMGMLQARDCRIVWRDGRLYVCRSATDIVSFLTDRPVKSGGGYKVRVGDGALSFVPPGCGSCRRRIQASPLGKMTVDEIVAAVPIDA